MLHDTCAALIRTIFCEELLISKDYRRCIRYIFRA